MNTRPIANAKFYNVADFEDVLHLGNLMSNDLDKEDKMKISKFCEHLIRSGVNSPFVLRKYISRADLNYIDKNGNNLLVIAILSNNFKPIDLLLEHKCPRDVKNYTHNYSADDLCYKTSTHQTVRNIFKKHSVQ